MATAKKCFLRAVQLDQANAKRHFHLAIVLEALGEFGAAAEELTEALRIDPHQLEAARRFSSLVKRHPLPQDARLNPVGLRAALQHEVVARDQVADAALQYLACREPLHGVLQACQAKGWEEVAGGLCVKRTGPLLRDGVFLELLRTGVIRSPELERLLTALRRVLALKVPLQRFADRDLMEFAVALERQCWLNEYVWMATEEELRHISGLKVSISELLAGDVNQGCRFLLLSLYEPTQGMLGRNNDPGRISNIRPRALRDVVARRTAEQIEEQAHMALVPRLGGLEDVTSLEVARQYEAAPYPRWTRLGMDLREGEFRGIIAQYFPPDRLEFMNQPFEVLVAGCGTGMDAIQIALGYGPNARVLALDLSAASLAYASRMADHFGANNIKFMQADIQEVGASPDFLSRFRIIACGGVLHHMADPFEGWRLLTRCLTPGGMMFVGLYSAIARRNLTALRSDPAYPGAGCNATELRAFRQALLARPDGQPGSELRSSPDFYTASGFRDLALHVNERCVSIPEIAAFLEKTGLVFRGFQPGVFFDLLHQHYPNETWPGTLERWAELENAVPMLFVGMYRFWCDRPV